MKKLFLVTFCLLLLSVGVAAQSGYIHPTADLLKESQELFDKLNKNRIDGKTFMDLLSTSNNETILPQKQNGWFVYIDATNGKQKFKNTYEKAYPFNGPLALVEQEGRQGIINQSGRWVIKPTDPTFAQLESQNMFLDTRNGRFDYVLAEEQPTLPYMAFRQKGKWGIIISDPLNPVVPYEYDAIIAIDMNGFIALKDQRLGYVRLKDNKALSEFSYVRLAYTQSGNGFSSLHYFALYDIESEVWDYYRSDLNGLKRLFSANQYGFNYNMGEFCIAKFRVNDKYNVFFEDGSTLPNYYKWITDLPSKNVILAIDDKDRILIVNRRGGEFVVCE